MKEYDDKTIKEKRFFQSKKKRNKGTNFLMSFNIINLSNDPSLKDIPLKPIQKINYEYQNSASTPQKINIGTNTMSSILKKYSKNKNRHNMIIFNNKKKLFNAFEEKNIANDYISSTIRSNGKFQSSKFENKEQNFNTYEKGDKKFLNKQNIKKFILNSNNSKTNIFGNGKQTKKIFLNKKTNKNNLNMSWKGLNISSHYLGNTPNNKFGITSNKYFIDKNLVLTYSKECMKDKTNYMNNSLIWSQNKFKKNNLKFITLNMPNHSNYFNDMSSTNIFSKFKGFANNQELYQKLISQMTTVFMKRIKKFSTYKSSFKNHISTNNDSNYRNDMYNMKQYKIFNNNKLEISKINNKNNFHFERNDLFPQIYKAKNKTYDLRNKFIKINIKNSNKGNTNENRNESTGDNIISIKKK